MTETKPKKVPMFQRTFLFTTVKASEGDTVIVEAKFPGDLGLKAAERKLRGTDEFKQAVTDDKDVVFSIEPYEEKREMPVSDFLANSTIVEPKKEK